MWYTSKVISLVLLCIASVIKASILSNILQPNYTWKGRENYYYPNLEKKIEQISILDHCKGSFVIQKENTIKIPTNDSDIFISSFPVTKELYNWWKNIPRPKQMRVDPYICDVVYTKKLPIFKNTGCQLPGYMSPSAPRCQTQYLKWICEQSRIPIESSQANGFVLPESDHNAYSNNPPPQPWLLTARNALVSLCGQISLPCGTLSTDINMPPVSIPLSVYVYMYILLNIYCYSEIPVYIATPIYLSPAVYSYCYSDLYIYIYIYIYYVYFLGIIHTNANCKATAYQQQAHSFKKYCPRSSLFDSVRCLLVIMSCSWSTYSTYNFV